MKTTCKLLTTRRAAMVTLASATAMMAWACARPKDQAAGSADSASAATTQTAAQTAAINADANDPCRYVTAEEALPYVGSLVAPPYRVNSDNSLPNPTGDGCLYRGRDGREITIQYSPHGGRMAGTVGRRVPAVMDRLLHNASGQAGSDDQGAGLGSAAMGSAGPGPWDNSNWFPQGNLIAYKGDAAIMVDIVGADGGKDGAMDLGTFLKSALPMAQAEPKTVSWYALKLGPGRFGIFDTFADQQGRDAHLSGDIAKALFARAGELFAKPPQIDQPEILASKTSHA